MDATKLLERQHREIEALFARHHGLLTSRAKLDSFYGIATRLLAQMAVEEELFYPFVFVGDLSDVLNDSLEEHLFVKRVIADLEPSKEADLAFDKKMRVLELLVAHHVHGEESTVFPQVRDVQTPEALDAMGARMERRLRQGPRAHAGIERRLQ